MDTVRNTTDKTDGLSETLDIEVQSTSADIALKNIESALEMPNKYEFTDLWEQSKTLESTNTQHTKYLNTLKLFSYGTYNEYFASKNSYIKLGHGAETKLKHLTIVKMAMGNRCIPYDILRECLHVGDDSQLEDLIKIAIDNGMIVGTLEREKRELTVTCVDIFRANATCQKIENAIESENVYDFTGLLEIPVVRALKNTQYAKHLATLKLFAYGTYNEYFASKNSYIKLDHAAETKLKHLTIVKMAMGNRCIPYDDFRECLHVGDASQLEDLIKIAIDNGIISGTFDRGKREVEIDFVLGIDIKHKKPKSFLDKIIGSHVQSWIKLPDYILGMKDKLVGKWKHFSYK